MTEWIDPRYADLVEALNAALRVQGPDRQGRVPVRGFVVAEPDDES